ncbi:MAG: hypothetical protein OXG81_11455 [Acidobacteria bacterium]|nr:hypothetical protein [Acidobacteriota bacterium]
MTGARTGSRLALVAPPGFEDPPARPLPGRGTKKRDPSPTWV